MSIIMAIINWIKSLFTGEDYEYEYDYEGSTRRSEGINVMPREIIAQVLEECELNAMEYSESKRQLPCTFSVCLSEDDFDFFYRANKNEVETEIVSALQSYARQTGNLMKPAAATLRIDTELRRGECRVCASFEEVRVVSTPSMMKATSASRETEACCGETPGLGVVPCEPAADGPREVAPTPVLVAEPTLVGQVIASDGSAFEVHDGSVVGIVRDLMRDLPDIVLHHTPDLEYCSQRHARFGITEEGDFTLETLSGNGSTILRDGMSVTVAAGEGAVVLCDGDRIILGRGNPAMTFVIVEEQRSMSSLAA